MIRSSMNITKSQLKTLLQIIAVQFTMKRKIKGINMSNDKVNEGEAAYLAALSDSQGIVCATVSDGHVFMFKRSLMQALLDQHPNSEKLTIFVKSSAEVVKTSSVSKSSN
jgi:hypothetical protein